jgi:DNA-binding transcriptional ArsR family regulator
MAGLGKALRLDLEVTIGLAGPHDLVERIVLAGLPGSSGPGLTADSAVYSSATVAAAEDDGLRRRLLMAVYRSEQEAPEKVSRLGGPVDTWLFASPAPLEYCRSAAVISCPAVAIQLAGEPLLATLLSASRTGVDLAALSFDTLTESAVSQALSMLGIAGGRTHIREQLASPASLASYHSRLWRIGQTAGAITCVDDVARRLTDSHVPVFTVRPTGPAIASALELATLIGGRHVLAQSQFAVAVVQMPALREDGGMRVPRLAREEVLLTVQRFLVREAQRIDATVSQSGDGGFLVLGTRESIAAAGGERPFAARARTVLGLDLEVGVGTGRTEREAEDRARIRVRDQRQAAAVTSGSQPERPPGADTAGQPPLRAGPAGRRESRPTDPATDSLSRLRSLETLARLAQKLAADASPIVDAELTGQLLSVTPRTARRQLRALADLGLALPLPPTRSQHPGRPRHAYRLVIEKLDRRAAQ